MALVYHMHNNVVFGVVVARSHGSFGQLADHFVDLVKIKRGFG